MQLTLFGECLARKENKVEIDPSLVDVWGIPALKINVNFSDNELKESGTENKCEPLVSRRERLR